jgi:hypothetical protein
MNQLLPFISLFLLVAQSGCLSTWHKGGHKTEPVDMTGGISILRSRDFGGQKAIYLADDMVSTAWVATTKVKVGIPFLLQYTVGKAPYHLRLEMWDKNKHYQSIEVREVLLKFENGECIRRSLDWNRPMEHHGSIPMTAYIEDIVGNCQEIKNCHQNVRITLSGNLINIAGETMPFAASVDFEANRHFLVAPTWLLIASES